MGSRAMTGGSTELSQELLRLQARVKELERESLGASFDAIASQIPDNLIVIDRAYRIQFINWTVPDLTVQQVLGTDVHLYIPEHHRATSREACERAFTTGEVVRIPGQYAAADGSISRWETRMVPLRSATGEIDRLLQISTNVTEREEASTDLARFFQLSVDLMCVATLSGYFKRVSPAFSTVLGWSAEELRAKPFMDFVHPEDRASTAEAVEALRSGQAIRDFENRYRCRDGTYRTLEWHSIADAATGQIYAGARDVTERRALEMNLRHARKMEAIGRLAGGVAHDFNNIILVIGLNAEIARRGDLTPLDEIRKATERAARLTRQLLLFSRREPVQAQAVDLNLVIRDLVKILERTIASSIRIVLDIPEAALFVWADASQLEQVCMNLCLNARDAMPAGGTLTIRTDRAPPTVENVSLARLSVSDTGVGIDPEIRDRIFDPFFTTKPSGSGTGLGLATVYGIVEQHGGSVTVHSSPGEGARFEVLLPLGTPGAVREPSRPEAAVIGGTETLLVAEDFDNVRAVVVSVLQSAGYRVIVATDGEEALRCIAQRGQEIALALLDIMMPGKTGTEVAEFAARTHPNLRVLFTSGYNDVPSSFATIPEARLLRKPYAPEDLLRRVRRVLDEP